METVIVISKLLSLIACCLCGLGFLFGDKNKLSTHWWGVAAIYFLICSK